MKYTQHHDFNAKEATRCCAWKGCNGEGGYPAPHSRGSGLYLWFCLEHVRHYNKSWNFFEGMESQEIEAFQKDAVHGHRPSWKRGLDAHIHSTNKGEKILDEVNRFLNDMPRTAEVSPLPPEERKHLATLGLHHPVTLVAIKKRYKELVKKYHPDVNRDDASCVEQFRMISQAYHFLRKSVYFAS